MGTRRKNKKSHPNLKWNKNGRAKWEQKDIKAVQKKKAKGKRTHLKKIRNPADKTASTELKPNAMGVYTGHRPDIVDCKTNPQPNGLYLRSSWEANYARYLMFLMDRGKILRWEYEPDTFWFEEIKRGVRSYLPDFKVWEYQDQEPYYVEVKGYMDQKSSTKLKRMAKYYPAIRIELVDRAKYKEIKDKLSSVIPNWESHPIDPNNPNTFNRRILP